MLGRPINAPEVIHHNDGDETNNKEENLTVFSSNSDHARYHGLNNSELILQDNGSYKVKQIKNYCIKCGIEICPKGKCCSICHHKDREKIVWPGRESLIKMLETRSYVQLGRELGVSDNAIRKRLKNH